MLKIRLSRVGRVHLPSYRIVVIDSKKSRDGECVEVIGFYNPLLSDDKQKINIKINRFDYWIGVGVQPTDTIVNLANKIGIQSVAKFVKKITPKEKGVFAKKKKK